MILSILIVELAEHSPIIIRLYNHTTIQGATFNKCGQLYRGHANAMALSSSPVVSAMGSRLDDPGSSLGQGKALCP